MSAVNVFQAAWTPFPLQPLIMEPTSGRAKFPVTRNDIMALQAFASQLAAEGFPVPAVTGLGWSDTRKVDRHLDRYQTHAPGRYAAAIHGLCYTLGPKFASTVFAGTTYDPCYVPLVPIAAPFPWIGQSFDGALPWYTSYWGNSCNYNWPDPKLMATKAELVALGNELHRLRIARGWTLARVAKALGLQAEISILKLERGRRPTLTLVQLHSLAQLFGLEDRYFDDFLSQLRCQPTERPFVPEIVRFRCARELLVRAEQRHASGESGDTIYSDLWPIAQSWQAHTLQFCVPINDVPGGSFGFGFAQLLRHAAMGTVWHEI